MKPHLFLQFFLKFVQNHCNRTIKTTRSDNVGEFILKEYRFLFHYFGIIHKKSVPYTPPQNGLVERKHRHLLDTTIALRLHANLPKKI